jgi:glyoxylase-like metal-dependent hydrolase (beta-lactamase superfamily II)
VDFVGGSWEEMKKSLCLLGSLDENKTIYPGHGESSTLRTERRENPYLREAMRP